MILNFISIFSRVVIGLVFLFSFVGKVRNLASFREAITKFRLFPDWASQILAFLFGSGELAVMLAMVIGGKFLSFGFIMAGLMLLVFSIALASVLIRKIDTSCNCFGSSNDGVSPYDVVRNLGLILCVVGGYETLGTLKDNTTMLAGALAGISAFVFVIVLINLKIVITLLAE